MIISQYEPTLFDVVVKNGRDIHTSTLDPGNLCIIISIINDEMRNENRILLRLRGRDRTHMLYGDKFDSVDKDLY